MGVLGYFNLVYSCYSCGEIVILYSCEGFCWIFLVLDSLLWKIASCFSRRFMASLEGVELVDFRPLVGV